MLGLTGQDIAYLGGLKMSAHERIALSLLRTWESQSTHGKVFIANKAKTYFRKITMEFISSNFNTIKL